MKKKMAKTLALLLILTAVLFTQSCMFQTPGASRVIGIRGFSEGEFNYFAINLGVAEIGFSLTNYVGIGFMARRPLGLITRQPVPWFPGIHISLLPILFRNIGAGYHIFSIHIICVSIGI